ncbi:uncharacterized protein EV420DRAFT_1473424 [Desarmillaria tabescens]|uniref:Uncharacterized protein n=1 Tax=Armillaria tabescens TaxID=1929756 RepID=A0AA39NR82_ARMTA|nr:uncharacterized protein EV420DRAFT_1473424 [Desarmillaria tabescens]KAK0470372.1 hypothetical protein EV420DRAFT_1473424 [Desarmillaria tabescens]
MDSSFICALVTPVVNKWFAAVTGSERSLRQREEIPFSKALHPSGSKYYYPTKSARLFIGVNEGEIRLRTNVPALLREKWCCSVTPNSLASRRRPQLDARLNTRPSLAPSLVLEIHNLVFTISIDDVCWTTRRTKPIFHTSRFLSVARSRLPSTAARPHIFIYGGNSRKYSVVHSATAVLEMAISDFTKMLFGEGTTAASAFEGSEAER